MDGIRKIRVGDQELAIDEWSHWPLYSTIEGLAGANVDLLAFSYIVGQVVPRAGALPSRNALINDTNMATRARINQDEAYIVFAMTYEPFALEGSDVTFTVSPNNKQAVGPMLSGTNLRNMQMSLMLELFLGAHIKKPMAQAPLSWYGQSVGAYVSTPGDAVTISDGAASALNLNYGTAGNVTSSNQRRWQLPIEINNNTTTKARIWSPGGSLNVTQNWRLRFYMDGLKRRPVIA